MILQGGVKKVSMSSDFVLSITTKDTPKQKNPIHVVMWEGTDGTQELLERISHLEKAIHKLTERQSSIFFPTALYPTPCGIEVKSRSNSFTNEFDLNVFRTISKVSGSDAGEAVRPEEEEEQEEEEVDIDEIVNSMKEMDMEEADRLEEEGEGDADRLEEGEEEQEEEQEEEEQEEEEQGEEEQEEEEQGEEEQEEDEGELVESKEGEQEEEEETKEQEEEKEQEQKEEQEQEQELQEAEEFKELVWKGQTYYKDSENLVYQLDTDGDLIDTPIGIWKEETQKLVKYKAV